MKCEICKKEVVLVPSASERAKKNGESPGYYTRLFPVHTQCQQERNKQRVSALIAQINAEKENLEHMQ
jgi:hypothetical protein